MVLVGYAKAIKQLSIPHHVSPPLHVGFVNAQGGCPLFRNIGKWRGWECHNVKEVAKLAPTGQAPMMRTGISLSVAADVFVFCWIL